MAKKAIVTARWLNNMAFEAEAKGHKIIFDAEPEVGGGTLVRKILLY